MTHVLAEVAKSTRTVVVNKSMEEKMEEGFHYIKSILK